MREHTERVYEWLVEDEMNDVPFEAISSLTVSDIVQIEERVARIRSRRRRESALGELLVNITIAVRLIDYLITNADAITPEGVQSEIRNMKERVNQ